MSLRTIELHRSADADGIARLEVRVAPNRRYRFIIVIEQEGEDAHRQWSEGFIERTYGHWKGELERAPQDKLE